MTHAPRLGESHVTRLHKSLAQLDRLDVNLDESSSMPSVKYMDEYEACSAALRLPSEEGINQLGESAKLSNCSSWKYLT